MKTVFSQSQVSHIWAAQTQPEGRDGKTVFYFSGAGIYSYRDSYCLATFTPWIDANGRRIIIGRETPYGMATGRHMSKARGATRGHNVRWIECDPTKLAPNFRDYARDESRNLARGHVQTGRDVIRALVIHAKDSAATALDKRAEGRIVWQYEKAADYLADAHALAAAILASMKGADKRKEARVIAAILADSPALPEGMMARGIAMAAVGEYPGWQAPQAARDAYDKENNAARGMLGESLYPACMAFWRSERAAMLAADKAARLARLIDDARKADKQAREAATPAAQSSAANHAAARWRAVVTESKRQKIAAAVRAPYVKAEAKAHALACKRMPPAVLAEGRALLQRIETGRVNLVRAAAIARKQGDCRRARWVANPAESRRTVKATFNRGFESLERIGGALESIGRTIQNGNNGDRETLGTLKSLRGLTGRDGKAARVILAALDRLAVSAIIEGAYARVRAAGRRMANACHRVRNEWANIPPLDVTNASAVYSKAGDILRGWPLDDYRAAKDMREAGRDVDAIARGFGVPSRVDVEMLKARADSYGRAASIGGNLATIQRDMGHVIESLESSAARSGSGLALDALASAERALKRFEQAEAAYGVACEHIGRALASDDMPGLGVRDAWIQADAIAVTMALEFSRLRGLVTARIAEASTAATAAQADALAHWRATGEAARGLWESMPRGAYFRKTASGSIRSSMGAEVSEEAGRRLWALIRAAVSSGRGKEWEYGKGPRVGYFHLESVTAEGAAKVGCHWITAGEARAFAEAMAWPPFDK